jgi:hypothetical protein
MYLHEIFNIFYIISSCIAQKLCSQVTIELVFGSSTLFHDGSQYIRIITDKFLYSCSNFFLTLKKKTICNLFCDGGSMVRTLASYIFYIVAKKIDFENKTICNLFCDGGSMVRTLASYIFYLYVADIL